MAEYVVSGARNWATVKAAQNGDGTGTFWANSFLPLFDRLMTIAYYLDSSGTVPDTGASLNTVGANEGDPGGTDLIGYTPRSGSPGGTLTSWMNFIQDAVMGVATTYLPLAGGTLTGDLIVNGKDLQVLKDGGTGGNITAGGVLDVAGDAYVGGDVTVNDASKGYNLAARTVTRSAPGAMSIDDFTGNDNGSFQATAVTIGKIRVPLMLPHGATLKAIRMLYAPNSGHAGLPAFAAKLEAYKTSLTTGLTTSIGIAEDDSANVAAYEQVHVIESGVLNEVVDRGAYRYHALVTSEFGANAVSGGVYLGMSYDVAVTSIDEG